MVAIITRAGGYLKALAGVTSSAGSVDAGSVPILGSAGALSSSMVPQLGRYRTGNWYAPQCVGLGSVSVANSQLYFFPFIVFEPWTFQNIGVTPAANPSATTNLRLGVLYDGGGRPGKLLFDAGTASITTSGGGNTLSLSGLGQVQPGAYWGIIGTDSAANGLALAGAGNDGLIQSLVGSNNPVGTGNVNSNYLVGYWLSWTFGAFASDYSNANISPQTAKMPFLGLQA